MKGASELLALVVVLAHGEAAFPEATVKVVDAYGCASYKTFAQEVARKVASGRSLAQKLGVLVKP